MDFTEYDVPYDDRTALEKIFDQALELKSALENAKGKYGDKLTYSILMTKEVVNEIEDLARKE